MTKLFRIGIVGAGAIAERRHLPNIAALAGAEVAMVCNRRLETAQEVAAKWDIPQVAADWHEVVAADDIDAILIGTPPYMHKEISVAALKAGKHVFCQARMAMNFAEAVQMHQAAEEAASRGLKAQVCLAPHCLPVEGLVRSLVHDENLLGTFTNGIALLANGNYLDAQKPLHWRQMWHISGYNTLELGMYTEVLHRWIGPFRKVSALTGTVVNHRPLGDTGRLGPVERPDTVSVTAEHSGGGIMTLHFSGVSRPQKSFIELHGTAGSLRHEIGDEAVWINTGSGWERIEVTPDEKTEWSAEADFVYSARNNAPILYPNPSFADGLRYMAFTEAVFRSAKQGKCITLPLESA